MDGNEPTVTVDDLVAKADEVARAASTDLARARGLLVAAAALGAIAFWLGYRLAKRGLAKTTDKGSKRDEED